MENKKQEKVICLYCEENETEIDDYAGVLLCIECADKLGEKAAKADLINRSEW